MLLLGLSTGHKIGLGLAVPTLSDAALDPATPRIEFTHVSGWTAGMEVAWRFDALPGGTRVIIEHDLEFRLVPLIGDWIGRRIIGDFFIQSIASKTLACFKELAEAHL